MQMAVQTLGVVAGVLRGCIGIDPPADGVDLPGQGAGVPTHGPLEGHVFDKVGCADLRSALVARASAHKEPQGRGMGAGNEFGQQLCPIGQRDRMVHRALLCKE